MTANREIPAGVPARVAALSEPLAIHEPDRYLSAALFVHLNALVVVINGDRELFLRAVLSDHVLIQVFF